MGQLIHARAARSHAEDHELRVGARQDAVKRQGTREAKPAAEQAPRSRERGEQLKGFGPDGPAGDPGEQVVDPTDLGAGAGSQPRRWGRRAVLDDLVHPTASARSTAPLTVA